jgi:hypothetical protein
MGMAYYDTEVGIKHPALKYDLFGKLVHACQKKGIAVSAYLNGGLSNEEGIRHRDWTTIDFDGREYSEERFTPYVRRMCYNSPYRKHLIAMIKEIAEKYPVSGFFIDCMSAHPCICPTCIKEMRKSGINWNDKSEVTEFSRSSAAKLAQDISAAVKKINRDYLLYFNGVDYETQLEAGTYFECECIPSRSDWGYEYLPVLSHYMRTLNNGSVPLLNMNGRFHDWGDFGGLRPENAIKSELLYGLANGMRPNIGDHFHPRGDINEPVFGMIRNVYKELQRYEEWFDNASNLAEIAVVYPKTLSEIRQDEELRGVVRMLSELKQQFDIVTKASDWDKYQILIFPDSILFDKEIAGRVKNHLRAGKKIIASAFSGLDLTKQKFVLENDWGVIYDGDCDFSPAYFVSSGSLSEGIPEMPNSTYSEGAKIKALESTKICAKIVKPYFDTQWDGLHAFFYNPPERETDLPFLVVNNNVAHFSHAIFSGYKKWASIPLRKIFSNVLDHFLPEPILKTRNLPSFARAFVCEQNSRRIIHILAYLPEKRGHDSEIIEDEISIADIEIALHQDAGDTQKLYLAPENKNIKFTTENNYIKFKLPLLKGYAMIIVE